MSAVKAIFDDDKNEWLALIDDPDDFIKQCGNLKIRLKNDKSSISLVEKLMDNTRLVRATWTGGDNIIIDRNALE